MSSDRGEKARVFFLAALMMISVFAMGAAFAGSAAAVTDVTANSADDVAVGQESVTQDVTFEVTIDGASSSETVTIAVSNALGDNDVDITDTDDVSLDAGATDEVSVSTVTDNAGDGATDGTIDITLDDDTQDDTEHTVTVTATLTLNTAGVTTVDGISYTVEDGNDGSPSDSASFDLVPAEEIRVTESNGNDINYAVSNVAQDGTVTVEPGTYSEEVTFDTSDVTLEGPNAGIDGDSARGDEATITGKVSIGDNSETTLSGEVVIDGVEIATTDSGVTDGVVSVGDRAQKVENATIKNTVIDIDLSESSVGVGIYSEEVDNLTIENNAFTESGSGTSIAYNAAESPVNTIEISENTLTDVDRLYNEAVGGAFIDGRGIDSTTVRIVDNDVNGANFAIGTGDSDDDLTTVDYVIRGNQIEASNVGIAQGGGTPASFTIENNDFTSGSSTKYIRDDGGILDLSAILNDQGNTFEQAVVIRDSNGDIRNDQISRTPIQSAVDEAESGDTILVTPGTYDESLSISTANIALKSTGGADTTTISYNDAGADPAVKINDDGVTLDGFTVERTNADPDAPAQAIYVNADPGSESGVDGVTVENNIVDGDNSAESDKNYGIYVDDEGGAVDGDGVTIDDNSVSGFSGGVQVSTGYGNNLNNIEVTNNVVVDNTYGVVVSDFDDTNVDPDVDINNNDISENSQAGVEIPGDGDTLYGYNKYNIDLGEVDINQNDIINNGLDATGHNTLNATLNWWGDASGPGNEGPGSGASVSQNVDFRPWLDAEDGAPIDTTETTITGGEAGLENPTVTRGASISFDGSTGEVNTLTITERSRPSDSDETAVTTAVEENPETTTSESLAAIEVTNAPDTSATIQITLDAADVANPSSVGIVRVPDGGDAQILPTDVASTNKEAGTITFEADTPGFSTFVAAELTPAEVSFDRSNLAVTPEEVDVGEEATVSLDLTNTGDRSAAAGVAVSVDGERAVSQVRGPVAPGETQTVSLNVSLSEPGEQTISVAGVDETATVTVAGDVVDSSVTIEDQQATGQAESVTVASATAPEAYVIAVHEADDSDDDALSFDIRGVSEPFAAGASATDVTIELDEPITQSQTVTAMLHAVDEDAENNLGAPLTVDGEPVTDAATVTIDTEGAGLERFDQAGTGTITFDDVLAAIEATNTDEEIGGEPVTFEDVLAVIEANNEGTTFEV